MVYLDNKREIEAFKLITISCGEVIVRQNEQKERLTSKTV